MSTSMSTGSVSDPVLWAVVCGCLLGAAVWLLYLAVRPPRTDLVAAAGRWQTRRQRYPSTDDAPQPTGFDGIRAQAGQWLVESATRRGLQFLDTRANLALLDRTLEEHLLAKVGMAAFGLLLPVLTSTVMLAAGVPMPLVTSALVGAALGTAFFFVPDYTVAEQARDRRADLRRALACYLDLVSMSLAGGRGVPEALPTAAAVGQGRGFELIARTVATARSSGITPWVALGELGTRTDIAELTDLGSALSLVAHDGAKVRESLSARASTQRRRQLAEAEGDAKKRAQSMTAAQIVLATGFLLFLGYPALINVLAL